TDGAERLCGLEERVRVFAGWVIDARDPDGADDKDAVRWRGFAAVNEADSTVEIVGADVIRPPGAGVDIDGTVADEHGVIVQPRGDLAEALVPIEVAVGDL